MLILADYEEGKTSLAAFIRSTQPRSFVWDPTFAFEGGVRDLRQAFEQWQRTGHAVYQPGRGDLDEKFDRFCELMLRLTNTLVVIDEPKMVTKYPQSLIDLHRLGHKRGDGVMTVTHSVWDLPPVMQQAQHLFILHVDRIVEVNALRQMLPPEGVAWVNDKARSKSFAFWYKGGGYNGPCPALPRSALQKAGLTSQRVRVNRKG